MLRATHIVALLSTALTLSTPVPAASQGLDTTAQRAVLVPELGLRAGTRLRIASAGGMRIEGRLLRTTDRSLVVLAGEGERTVPLQASDTVWTRGRATRRGAIEGGITGLALAVGATVLVGSSNGCLGGCRGDYVRPGLIFGSAGVLLGVSLGAAVGSFIPQWTRRYP